jgi:hypothetical protein
MEPQLDHISKSALIKELEDSNQDFKASVVAAELAGNGVPGESFFFRNQSTFKRPVSRDIEEIFWNNGEYDQGSDFLVFDLNREGIYDMLPEAMVHAQNRKRKMGEAAYKVGLELRKQERDARKFFSPLENEFHHRSFKLDVVERELLKNNNPRRNREFFNYFFEDSSALNDQQLLVLLHILPLSQKIRGNANLIGLTLSRILGFRVIISQQWTIRTYVLPPGVAPTLGDGKLGTDTVLNDLASVVVRRFDVGIMDVPAKEYKDFSGKGKHLNVLNFILPYFFPANTEYQIVLNPRKADEAFTLSNEDANSFLGFNSYI